jgi:drug/metabolite transporter (DMT)-like permease
MNMVSYVKERFYNPGVRKHSKNISWMFFARIGSMVISFLATAYTARNLGPTNYGELSYAISFTALFGFIGIGRNNYRYNVFVGKSRRNIYGY